MDALLPQIADEYAVSVGSVAFVATAYAVTFGGSQIFFGPLGDRYGKMWVVLLSCAASVVMVYACFASASLTQIALARFAAGIAAGSVSPLGIAWIGDEVAVEDRQAALARFMTGQIVGLLAGLIGGGLIGEHFGWRAVFLVLMMAYFLSAVGLGYHMWRNPAQTRKKLARPADFYSGWFGLFGLLSRRPVRFVLALVFVEAFAMFGAFIFVGASLRIKFGFNFDWIGLYLGVYCLGGLLFVLDSRRLINRMGPIRMAAWGAFISALCFIGLSLATAAWIYLPLLFAMGLAFYMLHNVLQNFATLMAPDARGAALALFAMTYFVSQAIGVFLAGLIVDLFGTVPVFCAAAVILAGLGVQISRSRPVWPAA